MSMAIAMPPALNPGIGQGRRPSLTSYAPRPAERYARDERMAAATALIQFRSTPRAGLFVSPPAEHIATVSRHASFSLHRPFPGFPPALMRVQCMVLHHPTAHASPASPLSAVGAASQVAAVVCATVVVPCQCRVRLTLYSSPICHPSTNQPILAASRRSVLGRVSHPAVPDAPALDLWIPAPSQHGGPRSLPVPVGAAGRRLAAIGPQHRVHTPHYRKGGVRTQQRCLKRFGIPQRPRARACDATEAIVLRPATATAAQALEAGLHVRIF